MADKNFLFGGAVAGILLVGVLATGSVTYGTVQTYQQVSERVATVSFNLNSAQRSLRGAISDFTDSRSFPIAYTDVDRMVEVLKGLPGITYKGCTIVDYRNPQSELGEWYPGDKVDCVKFYLSTEDFGTALSVLKRMEIPITDVVYTDAGDLSVVVLTGGDYIG